MRGEKLKTLGVSWREKLVDLIGRASVIPTLKL